jgi:riboflavin kinase / FMN adenylyltransferase
MEVIYISYPLKLESKLQPSSMAIGFFDGVHVGHQEVIGRAITNAQRFKVKSSVMTFDPHPKEITGQHVEFKLITPLEEKIRLLEMMGVDLVYVVSFSKIFSNLSPEDFIDKFLVHLNVTQLSVGFDFTFGRFGAGKAEDLKGLANNRIIVTVVPPVKNEQGIKISSTLIREKLKAGSLSDVNRYLGRNFISTEGSMDSNFFEYNRINSILTSVP